MDKEELLDRAQNLLMTNLAVGAHERDMAHFALEVNFYHHQMEYSAMNQNTAAQQKHLAEKNLLAMCGDMVKTVPELKRKYENDGEMMEAAVAFCQNVIRKSQG